jgi:hypothetical protein
MRCPASLLSVDFPRGQNIIKASWKKSALVIENIGRVWSRAGVGDMEALRTTQRWTWSADGRVLSEKVSGTFGIPDQHFVYDKQ